jgi:4-alpha-glucanotransferase
MSRDSWGIDKTYEDAAGRIQEVSDESVGAIRNAMGRPPYPVRSTLEQSVVIIRRGQSVSLPAAAILTLEDGEVLQVRSALPTDLPLGYHTLCPDNDSSTSVKLIVTPGRCHLPPDLHIWGWSAQLYATRSTASWGIGDLADLRRLNEWARRLGAGMVLINPLHATLPGLPQEASPYSPSSRRYLNPLYLRIEELPGASGLIKDLERLAAIGRALNEDRLIDRDRVYQLKREALDLLWSHFEGDPEFERFVIGEGATLHQFAVFSVLAERHGANWRQWPTRYQRPDSPDVEAFADMESDRVRFYKWVQWLLQMQLDRSAVVIPLMQDLPVGFSPQGADAWVWQDLIAQDMTVGAPPDLHSADGQDWGLPPFIPHKLRAAGYDPFIQTLRAVLRHAGGLRIDHVMGLFRLWWVPKGGKPREGAYVRYAADELLAIIALESHRAEAVVVGEDLGTVERGIREVLTDHNVLSYRLLWFEDQPPSQYPRKALAATTTHDLPTLVGIWTGADLQAQQDAGVKPDTSTSEQLRRKLVDASGVNNDADATVAITKTFEQLADAPSMIVMAELEAACAAAERPNMPAARGTYPNWSMALPTTLEELENAPLPGRLSEILNRRRSPQPT